MSDDVATERDWMRKPPTTSEELETARVDGLYLPVFEQWLNEHRWTIDKWTCRRCRHSRIAPFNDRGYLRDDAFAHARRCEWWDEQRVKHAAELEHWNSQPGWRAWITEDGNMRVEYTFPPRPPGRVALWLKKRRRS